MMPPRYLFATIVVAAILTACAAPSGKASAGEAAGGTAVGANSKTPTPSSPKAAPQSYGTAIFGGEVEQGGWIKGRVPANAVSARLGDVAITPDSNGRFFAGFDRDTPGEIYLTINLSDGSQLRERIGVPKRNWNIEHINAARRAGGPSESFMERRRPELERINAARAKNSDSNGWSQDFIWPVEGRISGRFGSQRVYRGEPGSYHSGLDIAPGAGVPFVAPADGVVVLAAERPFSLEGNLLIIDHGQGLNSAFLHASKLMVKEGDVVKQGQYLGNIGATGRATGPHLHWSIKWRDNRLDPLLFVAPDR